MAAGKKVILKLDRFEQRLLITGLNVFRNGLIREKKPTEDTDDLILKVLHAPARKETRKARRETR